LLGRVEVQLNEGGPWGAVCGDGWGVREAMVSSKIKHLPTKMAHTKVKLPVLSSILYAPKTSSSRPNIFCQCLGYDNIIIF
jgi:hypothetical protein